ncbi:MAG: DMT family transporter [Cyanophyceae cyanobacterium]
MKLNSLAPPSTLLVLGAIASTQIGAALAKGLIQELGPIGAVFLRIGLAAVTLLLIQRPQLKERPRADYWLLALFGLGLGAMNLSFYAAIERLPLGIAVTIEFIGPLGVATANSRRLLDLFWVCLAAVGIVLLAPVGGLDFDPIGIGLALLAASFWAIYIILSARVGKVFVGVGGLGLAGAAMAIAGMALLPVAIFTTGTALVQPEILIIGLGVAILSSAVPYTLELEALRRLPMQVFGVLLSLEPAIATLVGFVLLGETLGLRALTAVVLVTIAAVGASSSVKRPVS